MSLITACPACQTEFEVTLEQLEAYEGQVRCGTCEHVFNAKEHLIQDESAEDAAPIEVEQAAPDTNQSPLIQELHAVDDGFVIPPKVDLALDAEPDLNISTVPSFLQNVELDRPDLHEAKQAKHGIRNGIIAFILLLLLGLQAVYALRTSLAAQYPTTKPWLVKACQLIGCKVDLPKDITLLTIDDADMQEHLQREGVLEFSSTLINHGHVVQAFPMIELTLTNTDDEPMMRRSFKPEEYLHKDQQAELKTTIEAGLQAQEEVRVKMTLSAKDMNVAGFRVGLSYH